MLTPKMITRSRKIEIEVQPVDLLLIEHRLEEPRLMFPISPLLFCIWPRKSELYRHRIAAVSISAVVTRFRVKQWRSLGVFFGRPANEKRGDLFPRLTEQ